jgi:hypothetical protein
MYLAFSTWDKKDCYSKMLPAFLVLVAACCATFLSGCASSTSTPQLSDETVIREPSRNSEVHGEVGVMYGSNLGRR